MPDNVEIGLDESHSSLPRKNEQYQGPRPGEGIAIALKIIGVLQLIVGFGGMIWFWANFNEEHLLYLAIGFAVLLQGIIGCIFWYAIATIIQNLIEIRSKISFDTILLRFNNLESLLGTLTNTIEKGTKTISNKLNIDKDNYSQSINSNPSEEINDSNVHTICPICKKQYMVKRNYLKKNVKCNGCGNHFIIEERTS